MYSSMLRDIEFFTAKLGKLDGFGDAGDHLAGIVKAKEVKTELRVEAPKDDAVAEEDSGEDKAADDSKEGEAKEGSQEEEVKDVSEGSGTPAAEEPAKDGDKP